MCYSALVRQDLQWLVKRYGAEIAWEMFEELYLKRLEDNDIQFARALDVHVLKMQSPAAQKCQSYIEEYRTKQARLWEQELFKQRKQVPVAATVDGCTTDILAARVTGRQGYALYLFYGVIPADRANDGTLTWHPRRVRLFRCLLHPSILSADCCKWHRTSG